MTASIEDLEEYAKDRQVSFAEAMKKYDVVSAHHDPAHGSFVVMAEKMDESLATRELGYASPSPWTSWTREERVNELRGETGLRTYYDMKRADGTVRGSLRLFKTPILAARWFIESATESASDHNIADFIEHNLFNELSVPWSRVIEDALSMCEYGFFPFELVFKQDGRYVKLQKLAPRHPMDIESWMWDRNGGIDGIVMKPTSFNLLPGLSNDFQGIDYSDKVFIPIEKLVVFVLEQEAGDLRGISILRSAYKHYYYKDTLYKIDAIQKERHGIGIPLIKLPPGYNSADKALAEDLGRNLRTNERAHIVIPSNWEVMFARLEGQPVDCIASIQHHDMKIKSNILAPFMDEPSPGTGSNGFDIFYKSVRYVANTICDTANHFIIPKLVDLNFSLGQQRRYPRLRVRQIGEWEDIRTMSFAYRNFVGAGTIYPDDKLEAFVRSMLDLPPADEKTQRKPAQPGASAVPAPQGQTNTTGPAEPPRVGLPRQSPPNAKIPRGNSGLDTSGG